MKRRFYFFGLVICLSSLLAVFSSGEVKSEPSAEVSAEVSSLADLQKLTDGKLGVSAVMMGSGEAISLGDDEMYPMMSVFKFPLALSVLARVDRGEMSLDQKIKVYPDQWMQETWSPMRDQFPQGGEFAIRDLLKFTMEQSDNNACDLLLGLIGGTSIVQQDLRGWGIEGIQVVLTEQEMAKDWELAYKNVARPSAMVRLLSLFADGKILKKPTQHFLWEVMLGCSTGGDRLKAGIPQGWLLAHKTGTSGTNQDGFTVAINDAGVICLPDGRRMAVCVFLKDSKASAQEMARVIAEVAQWICTKWQAIAPIQKKTEIPMKGISAE
ncbi:MAG: class A beta-lactamase [Akkermansia sp.]